MDNMWYYGVAVLVSACWYPVLRLAPQLRGAMDALELGSPELIGLLLVSGVAVTARRNRRMTDAEAPRKTEPDGLERRRRLAHRVADLLPNRQQ